MRTVLYILHLAFFLLIHLGIQAQGIKGTVTDTDGSPVPYANIFIQETQSGTATDEFGKFFLTLPTSGDYKVICSSIGYIAKSDTVIVYDKILKFNIVLKQAKQELEEIVVSASRRDPAYAIIQKVIDNKKTYLKNITSYRTQVYLKATEDIETFNHGKKKDKKKKNIEIEVTDVPVDPFEALEKERQKLLQGLNLVEMNIQLNYAYPNKYKEERNGYKLYGNKDGLYLPRFGESDYNFYRNQIDFSYLTENTITSPISSTAILSYKYKLLETLYENGRQVYKIKVIPRKNGGSTCAGLIYINDRLWNINRLEVRLPKGSLKFYDELSVKQVHEAINDSLWLPTYQAFSYQTRKGKTKKFKGKTEIKYKDFEIGYAFPEKFFRNEVAVTTAEAYKRDSSYWLENREVPLTEKEREVISIRDSIERIHSSKEYKDSIQAAYNKVTLTDIFWDGVGFRNHEKQSQLYFSSLPSLLDFQVVGGFRLGPYISYFKRFDSGKVMNTSVNLDIGLRNQDFLGDGYFYLRYLPFKQADIWISGGRSFRSINNFDAYLNQLRANNYIMVDAINLGHSIELVNGIYFNANFSYAYRQSLDQLDSKSFLGEFINEVPPISFEDYNIFIADFNIKFVPGQKYMREPTRKVVLGSKWPSFTLRWQKGIPQLFQSTLDFDYLDLVIQQDVRFGSFGNTKYRFQTGKFFNSKNLPFIDVRRFRESDPILYSEPLRSFQSLDTSLTTTDFFVEFHHIHHFNGALINNIPLIRKTNVRVVAGGGLLWVQSGKVRHEEIFAGLERVIKLGPRRRLRVGVYGVLSNSNISKADTNFKISLDLIDTWKKDWSF